MPAKKKLLTIDDIAEQVARIFPGKCVTFKPEGSTTGWFVQDPQPQEPDGDPEVEGAVAEERQRYLLGLDEHNRFIKDKEEKDHG